MAKDLPYFKFFVSEWILGRIYDYPDKVQGAFLIAICHYWNKNCEYKAIDFERKIGRKRFHLLLELNFFEVEDEMVYISFLDDQHAERTGIQQSRIKGGLARAEQVHKQKVSYIEEKRREEIRGEEKRREDIVKFHFKNSLLEFTKNNQLVDDWLLVRKNKKATNTKTAFDLFIDEVKISDIKIDEILKLCIDKSWSGYKFKWVQNLRETENNGKQQNSTIRKSVDEKRNEVITMASAAFDRLANVSSENNQTSDYIQI